MKLFINSLLVGLVTFVYSAMYWLGDVQASTIFSSLDIPRPFVYRQLVPILVRSLVHLGVRADWSVCLVITFFGVMFYLSLRKLYFFYNEKTTKGEIYVIVSVFVGLIVFSWCRWMYDIATVALFTLALYYIFSLQNWKYLVVFALATLNRETSFLLIIVYVVFWLYCGRYTWLFHYGKWMTLCQIYIYGVITYPLRVMFQYNPGVVVLIEPMQNLQRYATHPLQTLLYVGVLGIVLWRVFRNWNSKPFSLRLAFVVMFPVLFVLYLVCGQSFEVRVFWEVYPLIVLLV